MHFLESGVGEVSEDGVKLRFLEVISQKICVKFGVGQTVHLVEVVVLPVLLELLLDLIKDFLTLLLSEGTDALKSLADKVNEGVIEATPLEFDVIPEHIYLEGKFGTVSHVGEFSESFLENLAPDGTEDCRLRRPAMIKIASVDLAGHNSLGFLEEIIFLVPKVAKTVPLLHKLRSGREGFVFRQEVEVGCDQVVLGWKIKLFAIFGHLRVLQLSKTLFRVFFEAVVEFVPLLVDWESVVCERLRG